MNGLQEGLEVLRIHAPPSEERVDIGPDRRLQRGEPLLEAPFSAAGSSGSVNSASGMVGILLIPEESADQRPLNTPVRQIPTFLSCTLDKTPSGGPVVFMLWWRLPTAGVPSPRGVHDRGVFEGWAHE